jgi:hypothetical protein
VRWTAWRSPLKMNFPDYVTWLKTQRSLITFEPGCTHIGPLYGATALPDSPPWKMDWAVLFPNDNKFAYVYERWIQIPGRLAGIGNLGYRQHFSFHYGPANPRRDKLGIPKRDGVHYPPTIRIDLDKYNPHIHFRGEDHLQQTRIVGMAIANSDPFTFMKAVIEHRKAHADFDTILKFEVIP